MRSFIAFWQWQARVRVPVLTLCCGILLLGGSEVRAAQAVEAKVDPPAYQEMAAIPIPGVPSHGSWCFDISQVNGSGSRYFLADATRRGVDVIDTRSNAYRGMLGQGALPEHVAVSKGTTRRWDRRGWWLPRAGCG
jgi:hypothetical protein